MLEPLTHRGIHNTHTTRVQRTAVRFIEDLIPSKWICFCQENAADICKQERISRIEKDFSYLMLVACYIVKQSHLERC